MKIWIFSLLTAVIAYCLGGVNGAILVSKLFHHEDVTEDVTEEYAICIAKENEDLLAAINGVIAELQQSGKLQEIVDKYISSEDKTEEETEAAE